MVISTVFLSQRYTALRVLALAAGIACPLEVGANPTTETELPGITILDKSNQGSMRPGALRDELVKTETISEKTIERSGATNVNEALDKNPGIAVQVECSICNVRNVLLNNLPGRYTTLLIDGIPIYSSVSSAYGLDSVSVWGIERIDVARGAGASLIAPEALAGTVNIVTKRPREDAAHLRTQVGSFGSRQVDGYLAKVLEQGALTATFNFNRHDTVDANGDGISEYAGHDRKMAGLGWFADDVGGFKVKGRLDVINEKRNGGALGRNYAAIKASQTGNPFDFSRGPHGSPSHDGWYAPDNGVFIPYDKGSAGFSEIIFTNRAQLVTAAERRVGIGKLRLAVGAAEHKQDSFYEINTYIAKQHQYYGEIAYQQPIADWQLTTGVNYRYEDLRSHGFSVENQSHVEGIDNYTYRVPAVFGQLYRTFLDDQLEINASLRYDQHNVFGRIISPRLNALYHHSKVLNSRISLGQGYRAPTSFFEQDHGILDDIKIIRQINRPEKSENFSYALSYADDRLAATTSYNYNRIKNFAILMPNQPDPNGGQNTVTLFSSDPNPVIVQGLDVNLSYQLTPAWTVSAAAETFQYRFSPGTLVFARPKARIYLSADYERGPWDIMAKLVWTSVQDLAKFYDYAHEPRYNFDGTPKRSKSPTFITVDVRGEYRLNKKFSIYAGADNLFNYRQVDKESPLFINASGEQDVTQIWGPSRGRYIYTGLKASF